ncbi:type VII secretion target [Mycobacterium aquaticum]|uniref:ESX-1 secretion-associated protein n=1 Tax=Mycobacterium aquaticum TaxID=1927124 RepID=A0A1X0A341_9MYCO|nr:type VII secretion target [Mycobacterium aquaticum]ORA24146.1 hypothetical protein BST13_34355 [Mycobacterium aquaticum]
MSKSLHLDTDEWNNHAAWWDSEADAARERLHVDDDTITEAKGAFGRLGSSSIGQEYAAALKARSEAGDRFSAFASGVASHIRRDLQSYSDTEDANSKALST